MINFNYAGESGMMSVSTRRNTRTNNNTVNNNFNTFHVRRTSAPASAAIKRGFILRNKKTTTTLTKSPGTIGRETSEV